MAAQELRGSWRRSGAGVQKHHGNFSPRKRLVNNGKIADERGKKSEAHSGFGDAQESAPARAGNYVVEPECEEIRAAHVERRKKIESAGVTIRRRARREQQKRKSSDQSNSPNR